MPRVSPTIRKRRLDYRPGRIRRRSDDAVGLTGRRSRSGGSFRGRITITRITGRCVRCLPARIRAGCSIGNAQIVAVSAIAEIIDFFTRCATNFSTPRRNVFFSFVSLSPPTVSPALPGINHDSGVENELPAELGDSLLAEFESTRLTLTRATPFFVIPISSAARFDRSRPRP
jgi:hypothetical protein